MTDNEYCYAVDTLVRICLDEAFSFLSNPECLGKWSLGCFNTSLDENRGVCVGYSLFSGKSTEVRIVPDTDNFRILFLLEHEGNWIPRITIELKNGGQFGYETGSTIITMSAWRTAWMEDRDWNRLKKCHDVEIILIKEQLERTG